MRDFSDVRRQRERAGIRSLSPAKPARKMFHECASMIVRTTALCWRTAMRRADQRTKVSTPRLSRGQRPARPRPPGSRLLHSGQELPPLWRPRPLAARSYGRCLGTGEQNSWYSSGSEGRGGEGIIEQLPSETSHSVLGLKRFRPLGSRQARQAATSAGTMRGEAGLPRRVTPVGGPGTRVRAFMQTLHCGTITR